MSPRVISERGLEVHSNGTGQLYFYFFQNHQTRVKLTAVLTYRIKPTLYSRDGSTTLPSLSKDLERLKVARIVAAVSQRVEMAMWFPGHDLYFPWSLVSNGLINEYIHFHLRPKPKAIRLGSRTFGSSFPFLINLSGVKADGSGYSFSS